MLSRQSAWSLPFRSRGPLHRRSLARRLTGVFYSALSTSTSADRTAFYDPRPGGTPPYYNSYTWLEHEIPAEDECRAITISGLPKLSFPEDLIEFFEESDIAVERFLMEYNSRSLLYAKRQVIVLKSASSVPAALQLTGEVLFNQRVKIVPFVTKRGIYPRKGMPAFRWGWYSNASSSVKDIKLRHPRMAPMRGVFEPYREGRHVAFANLPDNLPELDNSVFEWLYARLHRCDVLSTSGLQRYTQVKGSSKRGGSILDVELATREEAETICQLYDRKTSFQGMPVSVHVRRPPMKYLGASWDPGHNGAHDQPRDYGSAKNTNFETMQDEVYRKWLLKENDRGMWVAGHKY